MVTKVANFYLGKCSFIFGVFVCIVLFKLDCFNVAVAEEKIKQLAGLIKERETYEDRVSSLKKKLWLLVAQKEDLTSKRSPDKENLRIIKENTILQVGF